MRTRNAMKNISISIFSQIIIILLGFISRRIFVDNLGSEYLGVNGLLTNVLSMMVLIEGGIGISITYNLYKPLAENNQEKITSLVQLYKKVYTILAFIVLAISIVLYPFMCKLMDSAHSVTNINLVYFIFVAKNMVSYLTAYKWALINADQKGYVLARANLVFQILTTVAKMIILVLTSNYILYLLIELGIYTVQVLWNGAIVNKRYPYIKSKEKYEIDEDTKENINKNVKAMFLHNIGGYCVYGTDNILISSFVNVATVGLYSNYSMIINQLSALVSPILSGIGASVGNLIATEDSSKTYSIFKVTYLVNFWIYSFCVIFLFNLLEPFIALWLNNDNLLLDKVTFIFILVNFYLDGLRKSIGTFKSKAGLFSQDKYIPVIEGIINLVASIIIAKKFGLVGIFIGTTISTVAIQLWNQPRIVYKYAFNIPVIEYFKKYIFYAALTILVGILTTNVCNLVSISSPWISLIIKGIICVLIPNIVYIIIFCKTEEFSYIRNIIRPILIKVKSKAAISQ